MTQLGADVDELEELRRAFTREAQRLESSVANIDSAVRQVWWLGDDGMGFRSTWQSTHAPNLRSVVTTLSEQAKIVARNRTEQVGASDGSSGGGGSGTGGPGPGGTGGPPTAGPAPTGGNGGDPASDSVPADDDKALGTVGQRDVYKYDYEGDTDTRTYSAGDPMDETTNGFQDPDVRLNLGEVTGETQVGLSGTAEGSLSGQYGTVSGSAEYNVGASASGTANASIGSDGVRVGADGRVFVGAEATAEGSFQTGPLSGTGSATAMVGAEAKGDAELTIGLDSVKVGAGGELFVGGKVEAEGNLDLGGVNVGASGGVSYGLGVEASADAEFSAERVGVQLDLGATIGIGAEFSVDVSINPSEIAETVSDAVSHLNPFSW